jgi:NADPH:quinone reductase-like Zn-dependent oxidoreductase
VDAKYELGDKFPEGPRWMNMARWAVDTHVVGFDFSGVVVKSFDGSKFQEGDEVFGLMPPMNGSFAEFVSIGENALAKKPTSISF